MANAATSRAREKKDSARIAEIDVLWLTAGSRLRWRHHRHDRRDPAQHRRSGDWALCRGFPKLTFTTRFWLTKMATSFVKPFRLAAEGKSEQPFILVVEGSIPNENNKSEGYWASFGTDPETGQPITTCDWIDRLAPHAWAVIAAGTCATYGGIHAMEGNPTGCMGLPDYLGWKWKSKAADSDRVRAGMSGAARQHHGDAALPAVYGGRARAYDSAGRGAAAYVAVWQHGA